MPSCCNDAILAVLLRLINFVYVDDDDLEEQLRTLTTLSTGQLDHFLRESVAYGDNVPERQTFSCSLANNRWSTYTAYVDYADCLTRLGVTVLVGYRKVCREKKGGLVRVFATLEEMNAECNLLVGGGTDVKRVVPCKPVGKAFDSRRFNSPAANILHHVFNFHAPGLEQLAHQCKLMCALTNTQLAAVEKMWSETVLKDFDMVCLSSAKDIIDKLKERDACAHFLVVTPKPSLSIFFWILQKRDGRILPHGQSVFTLEQRGVQES